MFYNNTYVITGECIVIWDGVTQPEQNDDGSYKHNLGLAILETSPEFQELQIIINNELANGQFKGVIPPGGRLPFMPADVTKFGPLVTGCQKFSAVTYRGAPQVFDINGQELPAQVYARILYPGAKVKVMVHAFTYNNKQKGIGIGLDGVTILDATAPKLDIGSGPSAAEVQAAMTGGAAPVAPQATAPVAPQATAPVAPVHEFVMTPKANGFTREEYHNSGWTDEKLIADGMMIQQ